MLALTLQGCTCMSLAPDVCLTPAPPAPPVPTPYVNIFQCTMVKATTATQKVKLAGAAAVTTKSETSLSNGDEPGVNGGVASGKFIGAGTFLKGSSKVKLEGKVPVLQGAQTSHNANNTTGLCPMGVQTKVIFGD